MKTVVILGAGTAGTMMANKLSRALPAEQWRVVVVDQDNQHVYQPGLLLLPFGTYTPEELVRPRRSLLPSQVELRLCGVRRVEPEHKRVVLEDDSLLQYDLLIVATGTQLQPHATEGLTGPGWGKRVTEFYTLEGAEAVAHALQDFDGGRLVVNLVDLPIKCPVAPLEFAFLAHAFLTERGLRSRTELVYASPLDAAFTKPRASAALGQLLEDRNIRFVGDFAAGRVDGEAGVMEGFDGRQLDFDLLVTVPLHGGAELIGRSGLGDALGFVPTDRHTLQAKGFDDIFVIGDATDLPTSKAGSVAHFQSEVLLENVLRWVQGRPPLPDFDGHANCFIETGFGKAILIDFNYDTEPMPGRFPLPGLGPFALLEESTLNHVGKLGFKWVYWNLLMQGKELPMDHRMLMAGKWSAA